MVPNLVEIALTVQNLLSFLKIKDGIRRHLEFQLFAILYAVYGLIFRKVVPSQIG
jgi:hypothetical protein